MGCNTCNQQMKGNQDGITETVSLMPESFASGNWTDLNILMKLVIFTVVAAALPFILGVLALQLFLHLFVPKTLPKIKTKVSNFFKGILKRYALFVVKRRIKKKEMKFENMDKRNKKIVEERLNNITNDNIKFVDEEEDANVLEENELGNIEVFENNDDSEEK